MTYKLLNRVRVAMASAPGTGTISIGSPAISFQGFSAGGASDGDTTPYVIEDGVSWEVGVGTWHSSGNTYSRDTITQSSAGGTSPITASSGAILSVSARAADFPSSLLLANDTDVLITSPADTEVLTYEGSSSKWKNKAASGGGGGGGAYYERGKFAPPDPSWFDFSASVVTTTGTTEANVGMYLSAAVGAGSDSFVLGRRSTSGWSTPWTVTARLVAGFNPQRHYSSTTLVVGDSSGKLLAFGLVGQVGTQIVKWNSVSSLNGTYSSDNVYTPPEFLRVTYDGTNLVFGASWDGYTWESYSHSATDFLADQAYVGIGGNRITYDLNSTRSNYGVLCTYWDDPDHPAGT